MKLVNEIVDKNGNEILGIIPITSAVNEITIKNNSTGNAPEIQVTGDDSNIDLNLVTKGTGVLKVNGNALSSGGDTLIVSDTEPSSDEWWFEEVTTPSTNTGTYITNSDDVPEGSVNLYVTSSEKTTWNNKLDADRLSASATLTTSWTGASAPYTQTVSVTGMTSSISPLISPVYSLTLATALLQKAAWNLVDKITTDTNSITATCFTTKPVTAIDIQIQEV